LAIYILEIKRRKQEKQNKNIKRCLYMLGVIIFGSVQFLSKKITKPKLFFFEKKNRNRVKPTGFGSVFLGQKPV
jgi:hypothetical protein